MIFCELNNIDERLNTLNRSDMLYYTVTDTITTTHVHDSIPILLMDRKELRSFYVKANYYNKHMTCVECREDRFRKLEIEFDMFLKKIKRIYGV